MKSTLIYNAEIVGSNADWLLIVGEHIAAIGSGNMPDADEKIDAEGDLLMPGMIDTHVHFRDPGLTHKADIATESAAAVAGGITSYIDMPNTNPPTTSIAAWEAKMAHASEVSLANYAFYIGATNNNLNELINADYNRIPGVKLFLGSSTGNLLVDNQETQKNLFAKVNALISVHAEDNDRIANNLRDIKNIYGKNPVPIEKHSIIRDEIACLNATQHAIDLAKKYNARLHILHVSTALEVNLLKQQKSDLITAETCIQYLTLSEKNYASLGTRMKCNPSIKFEPDRDCIQKALKKGIIDIAASDHAPHLLTEKVGDALTAPSGMPNMQFQLVQLLELYSPEEVTRITAEKPAEIFGIQNRGKLQAGYYADIVRIKRKNQTITDNMSLSKCGWTPAAGITVGHTVTETWVNGTLAAENGKPTYMTKGKPLNFKQKR